jgi:glucose-6-phosphate 1-dehydrogenase
MPTFRSDALVFFGATGDLAYKQIFPDLPRRSFLGKEPAEHPLYARRQPDLPANLKPQLKSALSSANGV